MNKVSKISDVVERYLEQKSLHCGNRQLSFWYKGKNVYSYDSLLGIIDVKSKILFIDNDIRRYSNTTTKQTYKLVRGAIGEGYRIFYLPLHLSPKKVIMFYWEEVEKLIVKYTRAYKTKESYKILIKRTLEEAEFYADYIKLDKNSEEYKYKNKLIEELFKYCIL